MNSFIVYSLTMVFMVSSTSFANKSKNGQKKKLFYLIPIILFAAVFGMRYNVGVDYPAYLHSFINAAHGVFPTYEVGFSYFTFLIAKSGIHYAVYFGLLAGLQISFLYLAFKDYNYLMPFIIFLGFTLGYFASWMNGIRQNLVFAIFCLGVNFLYDKNFKKYLFLCLLSMLIHKSAIILLPLYPLLKNHRGFVPSRVVQALILSVSILLFFSINIFSYFSNYINYFASLLNYNYLFENYIDRNVGLKTGIGFIIARIFDFFLIAFSDKIIKTFKNTPILIYYSLFFYGTILTLLASSNIILSRPLLYFRSMQFICLAYLLKYLAIHFHKSLNGVIFVGILLLNIAMLIPNLSQTFDFFWQTIKM
jgi:hypothetical protein